MQNRYSIVISPPADIIALVKSLKEELAEEIGWFHSKNSLAHLTINEFMATDIEIREIKRQLTFVCHNLKSTSVHFDKYDNYPNGAFFIAPDEESKNSLKEILKQINASLHVKTLFENDAPHISVARQLKPKEIVTAYHKFRLINFSFISDSLVLRRFNRKIKQFEITDRFEFNNNLSPPFQ